MGERVGEEHQSIRPSVRVPILFEEMGMEGFDGG